VWEETSGGGYEDVEGGRLGGLIMGHYRSIGWKGKRFYMCMVKGVWESVRLRPHMSQL